MSLFGSLYVGNSGLQTSQNAINTVAHNLSNVQTKGYTRQQILQGTRTYNDLGGNPSSSRMQIGLGVEYSKARQVRDQFLDASYRKESGRSSFYQVCSDTSSEIETLLGELDGASFKESLTENLWGTIQELEKSPGEPVNQGEFVSACRQFLERAQAVYDGLTEYQDNLNYQVKGMVEQINEYAHGIFDLNTKIQLAESGIEEANDLRDKRNKMIDELSELVNIKTSEDPHGRTEVYVEGVPLVLGNYVNEMDYVEQPGTGFYDVTWGVDFDDVSVFNFKQDISADIDTDIGKLKATILARGDHRANYTDLENANNYNNSDGKSIAIADSIIMNVQSEFDRLIHNIVTTINDALTDYAEKSGDTESLEMFVRLNVDRYDSDGNIIKEDTSYSPDNISTMYTVSNLKINPALLKQPTLNKFLKEDKSVDFEKAKSIADAFTKASDVLNPNNTTKYNFLDYYSGLVGQVATTGSVYKNFVEIQQTTVDAVEDSRQQVVGVSSDDELHNMIKLQNAYNASSRYINAVNQMIEHILTALGR